MNERLVIKQTKPSKEELTKKMEHKFEQAFNKLGQATTMKDNHKVYDLLFEVKQIYNHLKEEK